jgi:predicted acetyltransferase
MNIGDFRIEILKGNLNDKPIFRNLMQYYLYDTSDFTLEDPNSFGQFEYNYLDHYWTGHGVNFEGRVAYLVKVNDLLAGFALVNNFNIAIESDNNTRNISEFFIMRKWRRHGVGKYVAQYIFNTFQGLWEVKQQKENTSAQHFWEAVVSEYTNGNYTKSDSHLPEWDGPVIRFNSN